MKAIKHAFGADNIVGISFGYNNQPDKQIGWWHVQYLNAVVYTEWIYKSTFILGRRIDFIPHRGSIDGSDPNKTAIRIAQTPVREVIAEKIQAMGNATNANPLITEHHINKSMKELKDKLDENFCTLSITITTRTEWRLEGNYDNVHLSYFPPPSNLGHNCSRVPTITSPNARYSPRPFRRCTITSTKSRTAPNPTRL